MEGTGQRPLFPPNVSGWKPNAFWINASAMERRSSIAQSFTWRVLDGYWDEGGTIQLAGGELTRAEILARDEDRNPVLTGSAYVDELLALMGVGLTPATRSTIVAKLSAITTFLNVPQKISQHPEPNLSHESSRRCKI